MTGLEFLRSLIGTDVQECIKWPKFIDEHTGYGRVGIRLLTGRSIGFAHRVMCEMAHGKPLSPKHETAHECDHRWCVNPNHLRWKTRSENHYDRCRNGTSITNRTGCHSKLTTDQRKTIISLKGEKTIFELALEYGVHYQTISRIQKHGFIEDGKIRRFYEADDEKLIRLRSEGLTYKQIAEAMGRPIGNIDSRIQTLTRNKILSPRE